MSDHKHTPTGAPITACDEEHGCSVVTCDACLSEVPDDVALSFEGPDYVQHFCGLNCMEEWKKRSQQAKDTK